MRHFLGQNPQQLFLGGPVDDLIARSIKFQHGSIHPRAKQFQQIIRQGERIVPMRMLERKNRMQSGRHQRARNRRPQDHIPIVEQIIRCAIHELHLFSFGEQVAFCHGMNKSQLPGAEEWRQIIDGQRASGLTVAAYCRDRGIKDSAFYAWKRRLRAPAKRNRSLAACVRRGEASENVGG